MPARVALLSIDHVMGKHVLWANSHILWVSSTARHQSWSLKFNWVTWWRHIYPESWRASRCQIHASHEKGELIQVTSRWITTFLEFSLFFVYLFTASSIQLLEKFLCMESSSRWVDKECDFSDLDLIYLVSPGIYENWLWIQVCQHYTWSRWAT